MEVGKVAKISNSAPLLLWATLSILEIVHIRQLQIHLLTLHHISSKRQILQEYKQIKLSNSAFILGDAFQTSNARAKYQSLYLKCRKALHLLSALSTQKSSMLRSLHVKINFLCLIATKYMSGFHRYRYNEQRQNNGITITNCCITIMHKLQGLSLLMWLVSNLHLQLRKTSRNTTGKK